MKKSEKFCRWNPDVDLTKPSLREQLLKITDMEAFQRKWAAYIKT